MNRVPHMDPHLKLYGIDQLVVVLKNRKVNQNQLTAWTQKHLRTSIIQSEMDLNLSFIKKQLKRDLDESKISMERTMLISDVPSVISSQKGKKLAMILGLIDEAKEYQSLYDSGADVVINSLQDIDIIEGNDSSTTFTQTLPSAFDKLPKLNPGFNQHQPLFFFDYDGTLAPITSDPAKAYLPEETRKLLAQMTDKFRVAIVSGRDMNDLKNFIGLDSLIYAGSHGFRISGPGGIEMKHEKVSDLLPKLDAIMEELVNESELKIPGVEIEKKYMAIAVHYRNAPSGSYKVVSQSIKRIVSSIDEFSTGRGKKVIEIRPSIKWHKGKAVEWILHALEQEDRLKYQPVYLGDDITDEDAFRSIANHGIGILVGRHSAPSAACCQLPNVTEVQKLFHYLLYNW